MNHIQNIVDTLIPRLLIDKRFAFDNYKLHT